MSTWSEVARLRRAQIVTLSISEIMLLLVFMAIAFSFLAKNEGREAIPRVEQELREAKARIATLEDLVRALRTERDRLKADFKELSEELASRQEPDTTVTPRSETPRLTPDEVKKRVVSLQALVNELQDENAKLRQMVGGKAPGLPRCLVTSGFMFRFVLLADGHISGSPSWDAGALPNPAGLPGVNILSSGMPLGDRELIFAAAQLNHWADSLPQPCRFSVMARRETMDAATFDHQLRVLEGFFYVKRTQ